MITKHQIVYQHLLFHNLYIVKVLKNQVIQAPLLLYNKK
jgi:hypothetical protein